MDDKALFEQELAKVAPEGHSSFSIESLDMWCPWAFKYVHISRNFRGWPICNGCLRPVDLVIAANQRSQHQR